MEAIGSENGGGRDRTDWAKMLVAVAAAVVREGGIRKREQSWEIPRFLAWVGVIM